MVGLSVQVVAPLLAFAIGGALFWIEAAGAFESCPGLFARCGREVLAACMGFGLLTAMTYGVLLLAKYPAQFQMFGQSPQELVLAFAAVALLQTVGKSELASKTRISGSPHIASSKESYYTKLERTTLCWIYRTLLSRIGDQTELEMLVRRGLRVAYSFEEFLEEFESWAEGQSTPQTWHEIAGAIFRTAKETPEKKRSTLIAHLIREDLNTAVRLAKRRAAAIVDQRAI